jgi:hypothetical protein
MFLMLHATQNGMPFCSSINNLNIHVKDPEDTTSLTLFPSQDQTLPIVGKQQSVTKTFTFINDRTDSIKVTSVSITGGLHFHIVSVTPSVPVTLAHNAVVAVEIEFDADTNGLYRDELVITTDHALTSYHYTLEGMRENGILSVASTSEPVRFDIAPNPSQGNAVVTTSGIYAGSIALYDIMGHELFVETRNTSLRLSERHLVPGTYIVRVSGHNSRGQSVTMSKKITIE